MFRGVDRRGTGLGGQMARTDAGLADQVQHWFDAGWRSLKVQTLDGTEVAGIYRHPDTNRRTWWSESATGHDPAAAWLMTEFLARLAEDPAAGRS